MSTLHTRKPGFKALVALAGRDGGQVHPRDKEALAEQLYGFLHAKKTLLTTPGYEFTSVVTASPPVARLWDAMLADEVAADVVHAEVGGIVPRTAAYDCTESRLRAMNFMTLLGWSVAPRFWEESGTPLDGVCTVKGRTVDVVVARNIDPNLGERLAGEMLEACWSVHRPPTVDPDFIDRVRAACRGWADSPSSPRYSPYGRSLRITGKTLDAQRYQVDVESDVLVAEVMRLFQEKTGIPVDRMQIVDERRSWTMRWWQQIDRIVDAHDAGIREVEVLVLMRM